jgi:ubiquinone/menaquinone biosynthesis C-methylase UbiE
VNDLHKQCGSDGWRAMIRDVILPWAMRDVDLGAHVLEVGPGYGATTDVLAETAPRLTAVEIDPELAAMLTDRYRDRTTVDIVEGDATALVFPDASFTGAASFHMLHHVPSPALQDRVFAEVARVLAPGRPFVVGDSMHSEELEKHHEDDTYTPVDPTTLPDRLALAGFADIDVRSNDFGWAALARTPG